MDSTCYLRSDTATRPTPGMRAATPAAEVEDRLRDDPTELRRERCPRSHDASGGGGEP